MAITVTVQPAPAAAVDFALDQNYPNPSPFKSPTLIRFSVPRPIHVSIKVYSALGQHVATLVDDQRDPGAHTVQWDGRDDEGNPVRPGVYLYRMIAGSFVKSRKLVLQ